jgi:N-acyl-phosphatidylethanolamine-hydrolysing phospholipase D
MRPSLPTSWRARASALLGALALVAAAALTTSCVTVSKMAGRNAAALVSSPREVPSRITHPERPDARLAVLWIGHATTLVQMDDKFLMTDPVFTETVGQMSRRLVEPGIDPDFLPAIDVTVISHMHFDHLSYGSLDMVEPKLRQLLVPKGGLIYIPNYTFETDELATWHTWQSGDLKVTAVPVEHVGFRYGVDAAWMKTSFTGWVFEYHGMTVYFGGDTAYVEENFKRTAARFPHIDVALLPIAPIHPRSFMKRTHVDPKEAVQAFLDLGAKVMIPIHFDTFVNSEDEPGEARRVLEGVMKERGLGADRVQILAIGEQRVVIPVQAGAPASVPAVAVVRNGP